MQKFKTMLVVTIFTILVSLFNMQPIEAINNFNIDSLAVDIVVNEDGTYDITEKFVMDYFIPALGFYRNLPSAYKMEFIDKDKNVHNEKYYFPITDVKLEGDVYSIENEIKGKTIVVGPEEYPRITGLKEYTISYKVHTQKIGLDFAEELFFQNLVSDWEATIKQFSAKVTFVKPVDLSKLEVIGTIDQNDFPVDCNIEQSSFTCTKDDSFVLNEGNGITARLELPNDYFNRPEITNPFFIPFGIIGGILLVVALLAKFTIGVHQPVIEKVMFTAPDGFNSPMIKQAYTKFVTVSDIHSLLFEWAASGTIMIDEREDDLYFTKMKDLESPRASENRLFKALFPNFEETSIKKWQKDEMYETFVQYSTNISKDISSIVTFNKTKNYVIASLLAVITVVIMFIYNALMINNYMRNFSSAALLSLLYTLVPLIAFVILLILALNAKKDNKISVEKVLIVLNLIIIPSILLAINKLNILGIRVNNTEYVFIYMILTIVLMIVYFIPQKTRKGADIYGEIIGLRNFIKYAKEDELIAMQNEHPNLYYDVLPYAFAFGITTLWLDHFKNIKIPESPYYRTYNSSFGNYYMFSRLVSSVNASSQQLIPKVTTKTGGSSFGGGMGGFSGGGGFGGGGGGGR